MPINFQCLASRCVLVAALVWSSPAVLMGQLPANSNSQEFVDAFMATERAKLIDKVQRQGNEFDAPREFEKLQKKHLKVFGTPLPAPLLSEFDRTARETSALTPEQLQRIDAGGKRSPTELSPELFLANAKVKFMEDIREEGSRFDTSKELSKVAERYEKNFGSPMPRELQDAVLRSGDSARDIIATQRADNAAQNEAAKPKSTPNKSGTTSRPRKVVHGVRYPDGLPDWFATADRDHDGQVGLYEWDRSRFDEFSKWDSNGDGLLEPREVLRATRPPTPPANAKTKRPGSK
ncbi:MAG: hypothetical protein IAG10_35690 [Planctomycetaceae bacterium]|nr:hypothetical protein [Planctomycetaceae bacterium]